MKYYNVREIAEMLRTNPETVRRWYRTGQLNANKTTKKDGLWFSREAIDAFLAEHPKYALKVTDSFESNEFETFCATAKEMYENLLRETKNNVEIINTLTIKNENNRKKLEMLERFLKEEQ